ncbi:MAG TPA: PEGA domain-containing protein [Candidatus Dojkabacteria bacterium]|nr:PEGA domain-containing protein [Candidatus Dojkabacteria bacterium]
MLKKPVIIILIAIGLIVLAFWSPWSNLNFSLLNIFGISSVEKFATLKVKSLAGEIEVLIDGEYQDSVKSESDFLELTQINPGEHLIVLQRKGMDYQVTRKINFEHGVDVVIAYEIGPTQEFSEGHILYTRKSFASEANTLIEIFSTPEHIKVFLDGVLIGETPLKDLDLDISGKHKLRFEKTGYDSMEIEVLPETQEERNKLKNLLINLEVSLFTRPVRVVTQ